MILFKREKEVIDLIQQHLAKVSDGLKTSLATTRAYISGNIKMAKGLARRAADLESEADLIGDDIRDKLCSAAFTPVLRGHIHELVEGKDAWTQSLRCPTGRKTQRIMWFW